MKKYLVALIAVLLTACGGGGGGSAPTSAQQTAPSAPASPLKVQASSYENKVAAANAIGPQALPSEVIASNAVAFADFFQDGTYSMVTMSCGDVSCYVNGQAGNGQPGTIRFYKNVGGQWVDHTSDILANNVGCLHPRKAIVADFNNSKKPGVFFACSGTDHAYSGEESVILLPQANGQYAVSVVPGVGYFHSASAADFNGTGYADIVVVDPFKAMTPYFLKNNGDGTFTKDTTRLPNLTKYKGAAPYGAQIYTAELIDFNHTGKYDLFLGGTAADGGGDWNPTIFKNNGDNTYSTTNVETLPHDSQYALCLDILYVNGAIYTTNVQLNSSNSGYGYSDIEKNGSATWKGNAPFASKQTWINWIIPYNGLIDSMDSADGVQISQ